MICASVCLLAPIAVNLVGDECDVRARDVALPPPYQIHPDLIQCSHQLLGPVNLDPTDGGLVLTASHAG
jgi:hypothetical protein